MKLFALLILLCPILAFSQVQEKTYTLRESQLTEQQRLLLSAQTQTEAVTTWTGVGKEVGTAIKEGLAALNSEVNTFSESPAGKFTMFIVAYKVLGNDAIQFIIGLPLMFFGSLVFVSVFYKNCVTRRVLISAKGPLNSREKQYQIVNDGVDSSVRWGHFIAFVTYMIVTSIITFA